MVKDSKKYVVITKIANNPDGSAKCVKHHVNDLLKYTAYLDHTFPGWRWFNVYGKKSRDKLGSFTRNNRPVSRWLQKN